jgi:hypothetical protein
MTASPSFRECETWNDARLFFGRWAKPTAGAYRVGAENRNKKIPTIIGNFHANSRDESEDENDKRAIGGTIANAA